MKKISIDKVSVQEDGKLRIYPHIVSPDYQYIYREASEVYWDNNLECFYSPVPREWDYKRWFGQIVSVVRSGFGIILDLSRKTEFISDNPEFKADMIEANEYIQKWMKEKPDNINWSNQNLHSIAGSARSERG